MLSNLANQQYIISFICFLGELCIHRGGFALTVTVYGYFWWILQHSFINDCLSTYKCQKEMPKISLHGNIAHQGGRWKIMGIATFLRKCSLWYYCWRAYWVLKTPLSPIGYFLNLQKQVVLLKNERICKKIYWGKPDRLRPYYDYSAQCTQVNQREPKFTQKNPSADMEYFMSAHVNPSEPKWTQGNPSKPKWAQVNPREP